MNKKELKSFFENLNNKLAIPNPLLTFLKKSTVRTIKKIGDNKKTLDLSFILNQPLTVDLYQTYLDYVANFNNKSKDPYFQFNFILDSSLWTSELIQSAIQEIYKSDKNQSFYAEAIELVNEKFYQIVFSNKELQHQSDQQLEWLVTQLENLGFIRLI